jgi:hypothetical protein
MPEKSKDHDPDKKRHPGPPGWGMGHEAVNLIPVKLIMLGNLR